jgi:Domain of Unknown Function (DUF1080)
MEIFEFQVRNGDVLPPKKNLRTTGLRWNLSGEDKPFLPDIDKARDSGILLHSTGEDGGYQGIWIHSIECQIIEGGTGDILVVGDGSTKFSATAHVASEKQGGSYRFQADGQPATINQGRINWFGRDENWSDTIGFRGEKDIERPMGEWNKLECVAEGKEISVYLNGTLVNRAFNVQPAKGQIQIQSEGAEIFFRNICLAPLANK